MRRGAAAAAGARPVRQRRARAVARCWATGSTSRCSATRSSERSLTRHTFLSLCQDASGCRVRGSKHVLLYHDWAAFSLLGALAAALPDFEAQEDGTLRSIVHYKGLRTDVRTLRRAALHRGFSVSAIALQDRLRWTISRLDNSLRFGVMMLDSSARERGRRRAHRAARRTKFAGNPGSDVRHPRRRRGGQLALSSPSPRRTKRLGRPCTNSRRRHRRGPPCGSGR